MPAIRLHKSVRHVSVAIGTIAIAALTATSAAAQLPEPEPDMRAIARTPVEILNIDPDDIPTVLVEAVDDPYAHEDLETCNNIAAEVAMLDRALGNDFDVARPEDRDITIGAAAKGVIGTLIPFRGIVSEVSGANDRKAEVRLSIAAGMVRRSYLKGLGQGRGCDYPARPSDIRVELEAEEDALEEAEAREEGN